MSLITFGLGHLTLLTMGLGNSFRTSMTKPVLPEAVKDVDFADKPYVITFENKEVVEDG